LKLAILGVLFTASASFGAIISTGGAMSEVSVPASLSLHARQSNTALLAFQEQASTTLTSALPVNVLVNLLAPAGVYDQPADLSGGSLPAGTLVDSYLVHFDTLGSNNVRLVGSVTFANPILAVIAKTSTLNSTDALLGAGISYATGGARHPEFSSNGKGDKFEVLADGRTLSVDWRVSTYVDQVRVVTAVPEPATLGLLASAGLLALRRR
jgi:hypothetical protein